MITRERAHEIATGAADGPIRKVLSLDEITAAKPCIYGFSEETLKEYWIAYVDRPVIGLQSSDVVLVSKEDGRVAYIGDAADEG